MKRWFYELTVCPLWGQTGAFTSSRPLPRINVYKYLFHRNLHCGWSETSLAFVANCFRQPHHRCGLLSCSLSLSIHEVPQIVGNIFPRMCTPHLRLCSLYSQKSCVRTYVKQSHTKSSQNGAFWSMTIIRSLILNVPAISWICQFFSKTHRSARSSSFLSWDRPCNFGATQNFAWYLFCIYKRSDVWKEKTVYLSVLHQPLLCSGHRGRLWRRWRKAKWSFYPYITDNREWATW